jgi:hypothetical protein
MRTRFTGRRRWYAGGILVAALLAPLISAPAPDALEAGFANPPAQARLRCYWWWLNGHTTKVAITRDLQEMKAKGYGGALLVDAGGAEQQGNRPVPAPCSPAPNGAGSSGTPWPRPIAFTWS